MVTIINSNAETVQQKQNVYVTSEPRDSEWGQPAVSRYLFRVVGDRLYGEPVLEIYGQQPSLQNESTVSSLMEEFAVWDELSDEALLNFESSLE